MALSDREQRLLDELERGLYESDPSLAAKISTGGTRTPARIIAGLAIGVIGISLIVFAVMLQVAWFGVFAFVVMLTGMIVASSNLNPDSAAKGKSATNSTKPKSSAKNFFEERWERRRGE